MTSARKYVKLHLKGLVASPVGLVHGGVGKGEYQ